MNQPYLIEFSKIGNPSLGYISIAEQEKDIPFEVKRCFWSYFTPEEVVRGRHAHHQTEMVLIALAGNIMVNTELLDGRIDVFKLDKPNVGLYLPRYCWHTMQYSHNAVQLVIASSLYDEADYIRSYETFKNIAV
jgi:dTDP-4-dehydrorhamnose 3,5-epimerase-like enzyme